jgi:outer membrane protein TolC
MRTLLTKGLHVLLLTSSIALGKVEAQQALDEYIEVGLKNNIVLQQKNISLEKAMLSLKIANGMYSPSVSLLGNYTHGDGGRSISLPLGDLLNPIYTTLNDHTGSNFPMQENVSQNFFPQNFYDVRMRASMPILNSNLIYNKKISEQQTMLQEYELTIYKRELIRSIKVAYYNYLSAQEGVNIYESALTRATEGKRVNESLLANGKGLPAYVLRSQSEIENINAQIADAHRNIANAKLYLNFLLNRNADAEIVTSYSTDEELIRAAQLTQDPASNQKREELFQMQTLKEVTENSLSMNKLYWSPKISGFVDVGAQAENLKYNKDANYYLIGIQLEMPLFAGFTNRHKISQSKLDVKNTELSMQQVNQQLNMSAQVSKNALVVSYQNYISAQKQLEAAQSYQRLIEKGYKEGVNSFIEAIDARNQLTSAQLLLTLNQYRVLIAEANLERETSSYVLK